MPTHNKRVTVIVTEVYILAFCLVQRAEQMFVTA